MAKVGSKGKGSRSAGTSRFVAAGFVTKQQASTVAETRRGEGKHGTFRNATSGELLTAGQATSLSKPTVLSAKLEHIERSIAALPDRELKELAAWFDELRWQRWDRQIEEDSKAGRLDRLADNALAEFGAGRTRPL